MLMVPSLQPLAIALDDVTTFISSLLQKHAASSRIVVCSTPEEFVHRLLQASRQQGDTSSSSHVRKRTLEPTIELIARASSLNLVFCPTVQHLRAHLSACTVSSATRDTSKGQSSPKQQDEIPVLGLFNAINLHRSSGDYSAQAIGRTLATAVEAAVGKQLKLVLFEYHMGFANALDPTRQAVWHEQVPILSRSVRTMAVGDGAWMDSTVSIRSIVARWCSFEQLDAGAEAITA